MTLKFIVATLAVTQVEGLCGSRDIETMIAGYPLVHNIESIVFDIEPNTRDIVVAGKYMKLEVVPASFIYFLDESSCKIRWLLEESTWLNQGIQGI